MSIVKHFCGNVDLTDVRPLEIERFLAIGGIKNKHNRFDGYFRLVGTPKVGPEATMPVTRTIFYSQKPSLHKCDGRCIHAKGHNCECSCGGANHGIGS